MKSPAFQFYPSDWLGSRAVRLMDAEQRGWYIQLLAEAWQSRPQATLPNDPDLLIRLADANGGSPNFQSRWAFVLAQFTLKGELLVNARLAHEKRKQTNYHQQRKEAGVKGAATRWRKIPTTKEDTAKVSHSSPIAEPEVSHAPAKVSPMAKNSFSSSSTSSSSSSIASSKEKKEVERPAKSPDERRNHPAIVAILEVKGKYPTKDVWDLVIDKVGSHPNVPKMKECWLAWRSHNHNPEDLVWLLDWYLNGIPEYKQIGNGARNGTSRETASQRNVRNLGASIDYLNSLPSDSGKDDPETEARLLSSGSRSR